MSQKHLNKMNSQLVNSASQTAANLASVESSAYDSAAFKTPAYHELLENPHIELDGLQRLEENLARLEDLHGRLHFLMRDISSLLKK